MIERIRIWGPFEKDSLRIITTDDKYYIFNYSNNKDWGLQTYKNYIDSRRKSFVSSDSRV